MKAFASAALAALLVACGGGGGDDSPPPALNGTFDITGGGVLPDPIASTQTPQLTVSGEFRGQVTPAVSTFDIPFVVSRNGVAGYRSGRFTCSLVTGSAGNGSYACSGALALPAQPVGEHTFGLLLQPAAERAFNGTNADPVETTLTVTP